MRRTSAELPSCLRKSVDAELKRVFNDEEDDLDGWELESEPEAPSADSSPLSSVPSSRVPSPTPSCAPSPSQSRAPSPQPPRVPSHVPSSLPSCIPMSESPRVPSPAPQVGSKRKNPPSPRESTSTPEPNGAGGRQEACEAKPKREKTEADRAHQRKRRQAYKKKKKAERQVRDPREYQAPAHALKKKEQAGVIATDASAAIDLAFSRPAYVGKVLGVEDVHPELAEQLALGRELIQWDGRSVISCPVSRASPSNTLTLPARPRFLRIGTASTLACRWRSRTTQPGKSPPPSYSKPSTRPATRWSSRHETIVAATSIRWPSACHTAAGRR